MSDHAPADPLRLGVCPGCAYRLDGLPPEGACPECGRPYDQGTVILYGWATGPKADAGNARPWHAAALAALPLIYCAVQILRAWRKGRLLRLSLFALWAAAIGWYLWYRFFTFRGPGLTQVRLNEEGCAQADSTADADAAVATPWHEVAVVALGPASDGTRRLRLTGAPSKWSSGTVFVDAEVRCTDEQAGALEARITAWRETAAPGRDTAGPPGNEAAADKPTPPQAVPSEGVTCGPAGPVP